MYTWSVRPVLLWLSLSALVLGACSSKSAPAAPADSGDVGADDGSTVGCTSVGGTCEPYAAGCPILQQNAEFCGNVVLVCCLPPGGETLGSPDSGGDDTDATTSAETGPVTGPVDAATDAGEADDTPTTTDAPAD
jgi:hypothetical protein